MKNVDTHPESFSSKKQVIKKLSPKSLWQSYMKWTVAQSDTWSRGLILIIRDLEQWSEKTKPLVTGSWIWQYIGFKRVFLTIWKGVGCSFWAEKCRKMLILEKMYRKCCLGKRGIGGKTDLKKQAEECVQSSIPGIYFYDNRKTLLGEMTCHCFDGRSSKR